MAPKQKRAKKMFGTAHAHRMAKPTRGAEGAFGPVLMLMTCIIKELIWLSSYGQVKIQ
jgi:hypothetical protein